MKRLRPDDVDAAAEEHWADLPGDLVRLLVAWEPKLLPRLLLVSRQYYHALLPHEPAWKAYFETLKGYSDHALPADATGGFRDLVQKLPRLSRTFYLVVEQPMWPCGNRVLELYRLTGWCICGGRHWQASERRLTLRKALLEFPDYPPDGAMVRLRFRDKDVRLGCQITYDDVAYYWAPALGGILCSRPDVRNDALVAHVDTQVGELKTRFIGFI